jgi:hypothetical protein
MSEVNYPAVVHAPHFEIVHRTVGGRHESIGSRLYVSRDDAVHWLEVFHEPGDRLVLIEHDTGFYTRCVVCGEFPDEDEWSFSDWSGVVQYLALEPGWTTTSEQLVFCSNHGPSGAVA